MSEYAKTPSVSSPITDNPWQALRRLTSARVALGRAGSSLPTQAQLEFQLAHAAARDAVHQQLDLGALAEQIRALKLPLLQLHSAASDRQTYLQRPDLGRQLDAASAQQLEHYTQQHPSQNYDLALVITDGLSALAVERHALPVVRLIQEQASSEGWSLAPLCLVQQGRVAIADDIGQRLRARMSVILLGERPGLSSPDSLGLYFTYAPQVGCTDAQRNCISNIRHEGLSYSLAVHRLFSLMREARHRQCSGVTLKDETQLATLEASPRHTNFLLT